MEACRYVVARFVPDPIRDEPLNIGVILQCPSRGFIQSRFLGDFRRITRNWPEVEARLLREFCKEFIDRTEAFSNKFQSPLISEPLEHQSVIDPKYLNDIATQYGGRFQFTTPKGTLASDLTKELEHLFETFVALKPHKVSLQNISPARIREKLHLLFDRSQLLQPKLIQSQFTVPGKVRREGWAFDFGRENHIISIYQGLSLAASEEEHKIDQAMILRGRIEDVRSATNNNVEVYAITHILPQDSDEYIGTTEARGILEDGHITIVPLDMAGYFVDELRTRLVS